MSILKRLNYKHLIDASLLAIVWDDFFGNVLYLTIIFLYLFGVLKFEKREFIIYSVVILGFTLYCIKIPPDFLGKVIVTLIILTFGYKKMRI